MRRQAKEKQEQEEARRKIEETAKAPSPVPAAASPSPTPSSTPPVQPAAAPAYQVSHCAFYSVVGLMLTECNCSGKDTKNFVRRFFRAATINPTIVNY